MAVLLALALAAGGARAQALEVFAIKNVAVDATAESAAAARELAIAQGRAEAYRRMLERLTLEVHHPRLPPFERSLADRLITSFRVDSEKRSAVRYLGEFTYVFDPEAVRAVLQNAGIPFAETVSKPFLVLPVLHQGGEARLWEEPNPWRDAWAQQPLNWGLVPFLVPLGDLMDMADVDVQAAARGQGERLQAIAGRYGAKATVVAEASLGTGQLRVVARSYGPEEQGAVVASYTAPADAEPEAAYAAAMNAVVGQINEAWKTRNLVNVGEEGRLVALVRFGNLGEWREIRRRLGGVASLRSTRTISMARGVRRLELTYVGAVEQLTLAMAQADLVLETRGGAGPGQQAGSWPEASAPGENLGPAVVPDDPFGRPAAGLDWTIRLPDSGSSARSPDTPAAVGSPAESGNPSEGTAEQ